MPEGDTVLRTARRLDQALAGQVLTRCDLRWPALATVDLTGQSVVQVLSRGKHLLTRTDAGLTLHSHLRMEGSWQVRRAGMPDPDGQAAEQIRAILGTPGWTAVGLRLGMLDLVRTEAESVLVGHLGPDLLGPDWNRDEAVCRLRVEPDRELGAALLDQRVLAGIGTFYLAETCFLRGVSPWTPVSDIPDLPDLVALAHRLLTINVARAVQCTTGDLRPGRRQWVHARSGQPCRRCRTTVRVAQIGQAPRSRPAFWCPSCQPGPAPPGPPPAPLGAIRRRSTR